MTSRPVSKTVRFQVFRRDGFQCLYCGRKPPDVVLQVDHAIPVSAGGDADLSNLITSCSDCNQGKRDQIIVTPFEWEDSELRRLESLQRLAELRARKEIGDHLERELAEVVHSLTQRWERTIGLGWLPARDDLRYLLDEHDPEEIEKAFYLASRRSSGGPEDAWRYACAVLRNWRSQAAAAKTKGKGRIGQDREG